MQWDEIEITIAKVEKFSRMGKCEIIYLKCGISKYLAFLPWTRRQVSSRRRRRSWQDSYYAIKSGGWLAKEKTCRVFRLVDKKKKKRPVYIRPLSTRASWQCSRTRKLRRFVHVGGIEGGGGEWCLRGCVYRYRFPSGRDNPLMQVQSSRLRPALRVTAHCCRRIVRKQHFRRSRWRQEKET